MKRITLKNLHKATAQEVLDQVAEHLLTQQEQSKQLLACYYRGDNGMKCAAGCLVADDEYVPEMEGKDWAELQEDGMVPNSHMELIQSLQNIHDRHDVEYWQSSLIDLYKELNLCPAVVERFSERGSIGAAT